MSENKVNKLLADFIKNPVEAKAFMEDDDKYLSSRGITILEQDKTVLKSIVEDWRKQGAFQISKGGHTNFNTHTDYNASDGHANTNSHLNHTSST